MAQPSYYSMPQAPGQYQKAIVEADGDRVNIYDDVQKQNEVHAQQSYVCGIMVIPFAYFVCMYMIFEGLVILLQDPRHYRDEVRGPFKGYEIAFLDIVAWGDILSAIVGIVGIWLGHNMAEGWRSLAKTHSFLSICCVLVLLSWRGLVCLAFPPWAGIMMAFSAPTDDKLWGWVLILLYMALSIFIVYVLCMAFRQIVHDSRRFQSHLDQQQFHERQQLLFAAQQGRHAFDGDAMHEHEVEPHVFGFLPLAETVAVYAVIIAVAMFVCFLHLTFTGNTAGGWAFFNSLGSWSTTVVQTYYLELFLYPVCCVCALAGLLGASSFGGFGVLDDRRALSFILLFLLSSMLRFALLFAVTGMNLLEKNTCGVYINGVAAFAYRDPGAPQSSALLHCSPLDWLFLLGITLSCIMDGYLIWATFQLWHHAHGWQITENVAEIDPPRKEVGSLMSGYTPAGFQQERQSYQFNNFN